MGDKALVHLKWENNLKNKILEKQKVGINK